MQTIDFDLFEIESEEIMLDVGCGDGRHSLSKKIHGATIISLDMNEDRLSELKYKIRGQSSDHNGNSIHILRGDALKLPFPDESIDKVVCSEVLEHIPEVEDCIEEINRVLKPSGELAISVPSWFSEVLYEYLAEEYLGKPGGHIHVFTRGELKEIVEKNGFEIWRTDAGHSLHFLYWLLRAIFGIEEEDNLLPSLYHSFLESADNSKFWKNVENSLNNLFPKSYIIYAKKKKRTNL